ncbi:hypothetical protein [Dyadobacter sp. Leaf189]|uniref:hypothetical protein n=1 Tax=Dyadobacter sp. Leaf189 TaxID=1736295 RepID=UPI0006FA9E6D|nr:hypothetical protein [Dyadobacter sp. Leaf189]KQS33882.1 hypothetical protein ASG33_07525 [Dyadobacter sp. Leaf189]
MRKSLAFLAFLFVNVSVNGQDNVRTEIYQETDTLRKQLFIDRYENVFMTKVPTRHMFKAAITSSDIQGTGINIGYEYKLLPSLSLEASVYAQLSQDNASFAERLVHFNTDFVNIYGNVKARWFYNMNKRIASGLHANNFSGTYIGFSYEQSIYKAAPYRQSVSRMGLLYGFQSRFFNNGYIDFALGLFQNPYSHIRFYEYQNRFDVKNFVLGTQANIGVAFGDWKRTSTDPACDVILCDESVKSQWKIEMPNISIGWLQQSLRGGIAYERRIGNAPLSVQGSLNGSLFNMRGSDSYEQRYSSVSTSVELRYYFLQKMMMRKGRAGNNLSGPYTALKGGYEIFKAATNYPFVPQNKFTQRATTAGLALGYQQRLFKRMYFDASIFYVKPYQSGNRINGGNRPYLWSKMAVGFTF